MWRELEESFPVVALSLTYRINIFLVDFNSPRSIRISWTQALVSAVFNEHIRTLEKLLDYGVDINAIYYDRLVLTANLE